MNGIELSLIFNVVNIILWIGIAFFIYTLVVKSTRRNKRNEEKIKRIEAMVEDIHENLNR